MTAERTVSVSEANASTPRLIRDAEAGDRITITRQGRPVARLVPYGLAVDEHAEWEEIADGVESAFARLKAYTRRHTTTPTTEENQ